MIIVVKEVLGIKLVISKLVLEFLHKLDVFKVVILILLPNLNKAMKLIVVIYVYKYLTIELNLILIL